VKGADAALPTERPIPIDRVFPFAIDALLYRSRAILIARENT
jgi:hypothetical protein